MVEATSTHPVTKRASLTLWQVNLEEISATYLVARLGRY